jgi:hypothetical protein
MFATKTLMTAWRVEHVFRWTNQRFLQWNGVESFFNNFFFFLLFLVTTSSFFLPLLLLLEFAL